MKKLEAFLQQEKAAGRVIYPHENHIYNALNTTPFEKVRVVILGQDPYHGEGQAASAAHIMSSQASAAGATRDL